MSELIEGMARVANPGLWAWIDFNGGPDRDFTRQSADRSLERTRAAWAYALAAMREPSERCIMAGEEEVARNGSVRTVLGKVLDAFAREHGLETPDGS